MPWADTSMVHLLVDGVRLKTVPLRLSVAQLRQLLQGRRPYPQQAMIVARRAKCARRQRRLADAIIR
jgi:hypothetical protein